MKQFLLLSFSLMAFLNGTVSASDEYDVAMDELPLEQALDEILADVPEADTPAESVTLLTEESPTLPATLGKRPQETPQRKKNTSAKRPRNRPLEDWLAEYFSDDNHRQSVRALLEVPYKNGTIADALRELPPHCEQNPIFAAVATALIELGIESSMVKQLVLKVRAEKKTDQALTSTVAQKIFENFSAVETVSDTSWQQYFTRTFTKVLRAFMPIINDYSAREDYDAFAEKLASLEKLIEEKYPKKANLLESSLHVNVADEQFMAVKEKAQKEYPAQFIWLEKNITNKNQQMAFLSLLNITFNNSTFWGIIHGASPSLNNNQLIAALCIYLYQFGISSDDIYHFIMELRKGKETVKEFYPSRARAFYDNFSNFTIEDAKNSKLKPQYFAGNFSVVMLDHLEPLGLSMTEKEGPFFPNQEVLKALYERFKKVEENTINPLVEMIHPLTIEDDTLESADGTLVTFIQDLDARPFEVSALLSIAAKSDLIEEIRGLPKSIAASTLVAATSIYLGHFGVRSELIHKFILKIREGLEEHILFVKTTPKFMLDNYLTNYESANPAYYLQRDFAHLMKVIFEPLLKTYAGQDATFENDEYLTEMNNSFIARQKERNPEPINSTDIQISNEILLKFTNLAFQNDSVLSDWIEKNIEHKTHKVAFLSLLGLNIDFTTSKNKKLTEKKNLVEVIKGLGKQIGNNPQVLASSIYLRHFGCLSEDIHNFFLEIKSGGFDTRNFSKTMSNTLYKNFIESKKPGAKIPKSLSTVTFKKIMDETFLPLVKEISGNPDAQF